VDGGVLSVCQAAHRTRGVGPGGTTVIGRASRALDVADKERGAAGDSRRHRVECEGDGAYGGWVDDGGELAGGHCLCSP
jgi:hypothetical protein